MKPEQWLRSSNTRCGCAFCRRSDPDGPSTTPICAPVMLHLSRFSYSIPELPSSCRFGIDKTTGQLSATTLVYKALLQIRTKNVTHTADLGARVLRHQQPQETPGPQQIGSERLPRGCQKEKSPDLSAGRGLERCRFSLLPLSNQNVHSHHRSSTWCTVVVQLTEMNRI